MKKIITSLILLILWSGEFNQAIACGGPWDDFSPQECPVRTYDNTTALDWTTTTFDYYKDVNGTPVLTSLASPFFQNIGNTANVYAFSLPLEKDFAYADGWRFVKHQFGDSTQGVSNPWFILYNIHSGILRIFMAVDVLQGENNYAQISLSFLGQKQTALLEHYNSLGAVNTLDEFLPNSTASIPNLFSNTVAPAFWMHADFGMYYDPCTCTVDTDLRFQATLINEATLEFTLKGVLEQIDLQANSAGMMGGGGGGSAGTLAKTVGDFTSGFKSVGTGATTLSKIFTKAGKAKPATPAVYDDFGNVITLAKPAVPAVPAGSIDKFGDIVNLFVGGGNIISGVVKVFGLLFGSSSASTAPAPPPKPLKFDVDLEATGTLVTGSTYQNIQMQTPGGDHFGNDPEFIPHYDNIMGIINFLEANAKLESGYTTYGILNVAAIRLSLTEQIEYATNPRAQVNNLHPDLDANYIKAAWEFKTSDDSIYISDFYDLNCFVDYAPYWDFVSIQTQNNGNGPPGGTQGWYNLDVLNSIRIKIMALFTTTSGIEVPYVVSIRPNFVEMPYVYFGDGIPGSNFNVVGGSIFPPENCAHEGGGILVYPNYPPRAKNSRISEFCNSTKYKQKSGQELVSNDPSANALNSETEDSVEEEKSDREARVINYDEFVIYPNPSRDHFTLRYGIEETGPIRISIMDMTGKIIKVVLDEKIHYPGVYDIGVNIPNLTPGTYLIIKEIKDGISRGKLVIQ